MCERRWSLECWFLTWDAEWLVAVTGLSGQLARRHQSSFGTLGLLRHLAIGLLTHVAPCVLTEVGAGVTTLQGGLYHLPLFMNSSTPLFPGLGSTVLIKAIHCSPQ